MLATLWCGAGIAAAGPGLTGGGTLNRIAGRYIQGTGGDGGPARDAYLGEALDVAVDGAGNVYIADTSNHRVRRVDASSGVITTVAGSTARCTVHGDFGPATAAGLCYPSGLALDREGNLYIADTGSDRVRKVSAATGIITRVVGTGGPGFSGDGGPAVAAELWGPSDLAIDADGNLFIADTHNHRVRKVVAASGIITTVAGIGTAGSAGNGTPAVTAQLQAPVGVGLDRRGNLFIAEWGGTSLRRVGADGVITAVSGTFPLVAPRRITVDAHGNVYVADAGRGCVMKVDVTFGSSFCITGVSDFGYGPEGGPARQTRIGTPNGVAADAMGRVYLTDVTTFVVRRVELDEVSFAGDIDGDRRSDLIAWRPDTGVWRWLTSSTTYDLAAGGARHWGAPGDVPLIGDIDGDARTDLIVWRARTGTWYWLTSSSGYSYAAAGSKQWGSAAEGDVPLLGDVDGDRKSDLVVWRTSSGTWYWLLSSAGFSYASAGAAQWGNAALGDVPLLGDLDGDRRADLAVWRASSGTWYWLESSGAYRGSKSMQWGNAAYGDVPMLADMDGDERSELIVWRGNTGVWMWLTNASGFAAQVGTSSLGWGDTSAAVVGDFDGDGIGDIADAWRTSFFWGFTYSTESRRFIHLVAWDL